MKTQPKNPAIASGLLAPVFLAFAAVPAALSEKMLPKESQIDNQFVTVATISLFLLNMVVPIIAYRGAGVVRELASSCLVAVFASASTLACFYVLRSVTLIFLPVVVLCTMALVYACHYLVHRPKQ